MPTSSFALTRKRLANLIQRERLGGLVVSHLPNIRYLTGFAGSTALALLTPKECHLFLDARYLEQASRERLPARIVPVKGDAWKSLVEQVVKLRVRRLGFESMHTPFFRFKSLEQSLPSVNLVPATGTVEAARRKKSTAELAAVRRALRITEEVFLETLPLVQPGMRERELAAELELRLRRRGADSMSFETLVASGPRSSYPHGRAGNRRLRNGDPVVVDFGIFLNGYASDFTRTVVLGKARKPFVRAYQAVKAALEEALETSPVGRAASWLDEVCRGSFRRQGLDPYFAHSTGHGVGLEIHEAPWISSRSTETIRAGDLVTLEPGLYFPGRFGVRIEDMVSIDRNGCHRLNRLSHDLIEL